jgi:hypothetical protein
MLDIVPTLSTRELEYISYPSVQLIDPLSKYGAQLLYLVAVWVQTRLT